MPVFSQRFVLAGEVASVDDEVSYGLVMMSVFQYQAFLGDDRPGLCERLTLLFFPYVARGNFGGCVERGCSGHMA